MDELEKFLNFWYGPHDPDFGESEERLGEWALPYPLRRFYMFGGRWPYSRPIETEYFYEGLGGHHLMRLDWLKLAPKGRLRFFMEYQGDWFGYTLRDGDDPPVWIKGKWATRFDEYHPPVRTMQLSEKLSEFLITHCLMTTIFEDGNSPCRKWDTSLADWFRASEDRTLVWSVSKPNCPPHYSGSFHLLEGNILVHEDRSTFQDQSRYTFAARQPDAIMKIEQMLRQR